ncbi:hypothetical protein Tco_0567817 [Tanacetum coccineum]
MSSSTHPIIILSNSEIEDTFSFTNTPNYTSASPDYFPASPGNTSPDFSEDLSKDLLASLTAPIAPPTILPPSLVLPLSPMFDPQYFFLPEEILPPQKRAHELPLKHIENIEDKIEGLGNGQREKIRHDDEIVLARVRISTLEMIIEDIQVRHRSDMKSLLDKISELKNHKGGPPPPDY